MIQIRFTNFISKQANSNKTEDKSLRGNSLLKLDIFKSASSPDPSINENRISLILNRLILRIFLDFKKF